MIRLQITSRHFPLTEAEEGTIHRAAAALDGYADRITSCRVMVEMARRRWRAGAKHHVQVDLQLPGEEVVRTRQANEDFRAAVQEAFDSAYSTAARMLSPRS